MASAFEWVVKRVVRELDHSGELVPVDSLRNSASFQPYRLLSRKSRSSWFWRRRYVCVDLFIRDILEPSAPEPAVECISPIHFKDTVDSNKQVSVKVAAPGQGKFAFEATVSGSSSASMNVCTLRVSPNTWEAMLRERHLRQPEHKVLQQLRNRGDDVFMVTEVLQTQEEVEVTQTRKQEGSGQLALPGAIGSQVKGQGQGHVSQKKTVVIPSGSILAFRVAQLVITGSDLNIHVILNKKQRTFVTFRAGGRKVPGDAGNRPQQSSIFSMMTSILYDRFKIQSDGLTEDSVPTEDFQGLQMEVSICSEVLKNFSKMLCGKLLGALGQVLRDQQALQALEESLEQGQQCGLVEPLSGPAGDVLECLVLPSRRLAEELTDPIFYLLEALAALSETQHMLLAQVLEARALLEPFKLVEGLLEQSVPWKECRAVSLPPELQGSWGSEAPAWGLLEGCGLELQVGAPQVCWEPEAQGCTCALYACLALLLKLSQLC